jgi:hypothetical protein
MGRERRTLLIVGALVLALGAVGWTFFGSSAATPSASAGAARQPRSSGSDATALPAADAMTVRLVALDRERDEPLNATRNPFRFGSRAAAPSPAPPASAAPSSASTAPPAPPTSAPGAAAAIPLKFIGVVEKADGAKYAVLSQGDGRAPMFGREGDIIDGRYRVARIGVESIELAPLDGRPAQTIRMTGQ